MTYASICKNGESTIIRHRYWSRETVVRTCIKHDLFTHGTNREYESMLEKVESSEPTTAAMFNVASLIFQSSEGRTVAEIMTLLERDAVITTFEIK